MLRPRSLPPLAVLLAAALPAAAWSPQELWDAWPKARVVEAAAPCLAPAELQRELAELAARHAGRIGVEEIGRSAQGRPISLLTVGGGERRVLLWSQMHGDEPSATPALLDLVGFLLAAPERPESRRILDELTLLVLPMLNPDGAAVSERRNAQAIDVNRDARHLATAEGRLLARLRDTHRPLLGFNLHDQNRRHTVGATGVLATNAVLAVAGDEEGTVTPGRERAMRAAVAIAEALAPLVPGGMARYDDTFTPRAFGDELTRRGTPVVLVESGGLPPGRPFSDLTRLNFVALLVALSGLAEDDLAAYDAAAYEAIPDNELGGWADVAVRGGRVRQPGSSLPYRADLAFDVLRSDREWAGCAPAGAARSRLVEVGDSRHLAAGREVPAADRMLLPPWRVAVAGWRAGEWLDGEALERLARLGAGTVHWVVPAPRHWQATVRARELAAPGRARIEVAVGGEEEEEEEEAEQAAMEEAGAAGEPFDDGRPLELRRAPGEPASDSLADVLRALVGERQARRLLALPVDQALARLWAAAGEPSWPPLAPGQPASFLLVAPAAAERLDLAGDRLVATWLEGREVPPVRGETAGGETAAPRLPAPAAGAAGGEPLPAGSPLDAPLDASAAAWVETALDRLSLAEKAAQMVLVRASGRYHHPDSEEARQLLALVRDLRVGGLVLSTSEVESVPRLLDELQAASPLPLLVAADLERSVAFRIAEGTTPLPFAMALGATRSPAAARFAGELTAREARALGIHWALAPVADVNNHPANPVIHLRSFGEDPQLVATMAAAFVAGAREGGLLTTAKHFPGHGDTAIDSHDALPVLAVDRARLEALEWVPFRAAIAAGVDAVMVAHLAVPALDPSGAPASLSPILAGGLLRSAMGYRGLLVPDALDMPGIRPAWTGEAAVRAVAAGADVVLMPEDPRVAVQSLVRAVREGQLSEERLDQSVRRLLAVKAGLGLDRRRAVGGDALRREVARPQDVARAEAIAAAALTVVGDEAGLLPLRAEEPLALLHLELAEVGRPRPRRIGEELARRRIPTTSEQLGPALTPAEVDRLVALAAQHTHVVVAASLGPGTAAEPAVGEGWNALLARLRAAAVPAIVISLGTPYLPAALPEAGAHLLTYGDAASSQRAAVRGLLGEVEIAGRLPVTLPGLAPYGGGGRLPRRPMTLRPATAEEAVGDRERWAAVDRLLDDSVAAGAFPGGVLAIGHRGRLAHLRPFGRLSYAEGSPAVTAATLYDIASLTKVVATTTMAMILVDEGRLDLDKPVRDFLPGFQGAGKERVTVRHLLAHSAGVDWWAPLHEELRGQGAYVERIQAMELVSPPGERTLYSDLGLILLGEILERVAGVPLATFTGERVLAPLGMAETRFRPPAELRHRIAPTEVDPWRQRLLHGEVHDENAAALGGVAPHAGLFSTAGDLARFAQTMLWGGVFEHRRIVSRRVVELFTRPAGLPAGTTRALGWDTRSATGSSAGELFSPRSFGHTGFTGTSLWIDPERELFVVLLTNRVHPTRENTLIREVRPALADAVVRALERP